MKLKKAQLFYLVIKSMKPSAVPRVRDEKLREVSVPYFFERRVITDVIENFQ